MCSRLRMRARQSPKWILLRGASRRREALQARTHSSGCRRVCLGGDGLRLGHAATKCVDLRVDTRKSTQRVLLRGVSWRHESSRMRTRSFGTECVLRLAGAKCGVRHVSGSGLPPGGRRTLIEPRCRVPRGDVRGSRSERHPSGQRARRLATMRCSVGQTGSTWSCLRAGSRPRHRVFCCRVLRGNVRRIVRTRGSSEHRERSTRR